VHEAPRHLMHGARRVPGQPQEGRALVRVALDDLCDVGRHRLVVDSVRGACRGGRDGSDDGGDGALQDGASLQRCRGFMGLRGTRRAAEAREACLAPAAGCQASVQPSLQGLQVRRVEGRDSACKEQLIEHRFAGFGQLWQPLKPNEVPLPRSQDNPLSHIRILLGHGGIATRAMSAPGRLVDARYVSRPTCCIRALDARRQRLARVTGRNVFRNAASPFRRCAAMMYPFLRGDSRFVQC